MVLTFNILQKGVMNNTVLTRSNNTLMASHHQPCTSVPHPLPFTLPNNKII